MKVLSIGADRSTRGILYPGTPAYLRQRAYAQQFGSLTIIGFSLKSDRAETLHDGPLTVLPTQSRHRLLCGWDALKIAASLPKPDVVSVQDPFETGLLGWLIARRYGVPLHVQVHTGFLSPAYAKHSMLNRMRRMLAPFVLRRAAGVRVVSERLAAGLRSSYRLRAEPQVLPIYVDIERIRNLAEDSSLSVRFAAFRTKLLVVSRLEPEKNVALALRAFKESAPPSSCLIVVGDGSERSSLGRLAHELGIADRVCFEGAVEALPYYRVADVVLFPSKYEGYGLVIVEALASGTPVIATDVGVAREAGAIVCDEGQFGQCLARWFSEGPREGVLQRYPYDSFAAYVQRYATNIAACVVGENAR